jgi:hypothetical protein
MHLYDTTDPEVVNGRPKFWITIIVISVATWAIAGFGYWVVRTGRKDSWKKAWKSKREPKTNVEDTKATAQKATWEGLRKKVFRRRTSSKGEGKGKEKAVESEV